MTNLVRQVFRVAVAVVEIRSVVPEVSAASSTHFLAATHRSVVAGDNNLGPKADQILKRKLKSILLTQFLDVALRFRSGRQ